MQDGYIRSENRAEALSEYFQHYFPEKHSMQQQDWFWLVATWQVGGLNVTRNQDINATDDEEQFI